MYDMIHELDKLEHLLPSYPSMTRALSLVIRNKIWPRSNERKLSAMLYACNLVYTCSVSIFGSHPDLLEGYIDYLDNHSGLYSSEPLTQYYNDARLPILRMRTRELLLARWNQLNPYFGGNITSDNIFSNNFVDTLGDLFRSIIDVYPDDFLVPLGSFPVLIRGRTGEWHEERDLEACPIDVAIKNHSVCRWNPPNKRYLYAAIVDTPSNANAQVCFEEARLGSGQAMTICNLDINPVSADKKIINMDFSTASFDSLNAELQEEQRIVEHSIIEQMLANGIKPTDENIRRELRASSSMLHHAAAVFCGRFFLEELCNTIFAPLDNNEDSNLDLKEKCYGAFRTLAVFFENHGIDGIIYPSTRMKLIGKSGTNIVIFDADDAKPNISTFRVLQKDNMGNIIEV